MAGGSHIDDNQLTRLMEGALADTRIAEIEDHIDDCPACGELMIRVARAVAPEAALEPGQTVGRYRIVRELGSGGMGVVHVAHDPVLQRKVALKLVKPDGGEDGARTERLLGEARALAALAHPNVVAVHDAGVVDGRVFVAAELVEGRTVSQWTRDEAPGLTEVVDVYRQAARGLVAAHAAGIVHRDIKPDNILLGDDGRVRVADFGLASSAGRGRVRELAASRASASAAATPAPLTVSGALLGTPLYMAPEQLLGEPADARSDQFAFCVSLYESRYRQRPFAGKTLPELVDNVVQGRVRAVEVASEPARRLHAIILQGLQPLPADRHASMAALLAELDALAAPAPVSVPPRRSRRVLLLAAAAAAVGGGALALVLSGRFDSHEPPVERLPLSDLAMPALTAAPVAAPPVAPPAPPPAPAPAPAPPPPVRTAPAPPPAARPDQQAAAEAAMRYGDASRLVAARDGKGCRSALAGAARLGPPLFDVDLVRGRCQMLAGDCEGGKRLVGEFMARQGVSAAAAAADVDREARMHCSTATGSWQERLARLQMQAHFATAHRELGPRFARDLHAAVGDAGAGLDRSHAVDVYNVAGTVAEALARHRDCAGARAIRRLGLVTYLGPDHRDDPPAATEIVSDALRACLQP